ncbi:MAG: wax ester/triacylglycerol synthase family O-acyltransferase [Chromatiales bacterium]|nr:wax ester/triacylglycerol synthase family O-acyltransferase [Chromatiales bacterium]
MTGMSVIDLAFLLAETDDSPKHVAGLQIFRKPIGMEADFLDRLYQHWLSSAVDPPFSQIPDFHLGSFPGWRDAPCVTLSDHLHRHDLPKPGTRSSLMALVGRLHSVRMSPEAPLWECHLIDGLSNNRFAVFFKIHHAYGDGHSIRHWLTRPLSKRRRRWPVQAYWQSHHGESQGSAVLASTRRGLDLALEQISPVPGILQMGVRQGLKWLGVGRNGMVPPFSAPRTPLNTRLGPDREIALLRFPMETLIRIGKHNGCTLNDVILAICDQALTRYLARYGGLPQQPLVAQVPVSLREDSQNWQGNRVTLALVQLAGPDADPRQRLRAIHDASEDAKREVHGISQASMNGYISLVAGGVLAAEALGFGASVPPLGNVLISNVRGEQDIQYMANARLLEAYPISTLMPSLALNITVHSYAGTLFAGLVCDPCVLRKLPALARYTRQAYRELQGMAA